MGRAKATPELQALKKYRDELKKLADRYEKKVASAHDKLIALRGEYPDEESIDDAWGYGEITREQRDALMASIQEEDTKGVESLTLGYIKKDLSQLIAEIRDMEWEALPPAEQERIKKGNEEYRASLHQRAAELTGGR